MQFGADRTHQACVESFGADWNEILACVQSDFATNQQLGYEQVTCECFSFYSKHVVWFLFLYILFIAPVIADTNWVPTIAYNSEINALSHSRDAGPLKDILCGKIHNTNPACALKRRYWERLWWFKSLTSYKLCRTEASFLCICKV